MARNNLLQPVLGPSLLLEPEKQLFGVTILPAAGVDLLLGAVGGGT